MEDSVVGQLAIYARSQPDKAAIVAGGDSISYGGLYDSVRGFCAYLKHNGIKKGDFVVCRASAAVWYWTAFFGVHLAGGVFVPLEKDCSDETIASTAHSLGDVFAVISIASDAEAVLDACKVFVPQSSVAALARSHFDPEAFFDFPKSDDIGQILFTTGTTGKAKGVVLDHKYFIEPARRNTELPYGTATVMALPAPMNHLLSVGRCTCVLLHGGTAVLLDGLTDLGAFYSAVDDAGVNSFTLPPSALNYIIALTGDEFSARADRFAFIEIGGEKLPRARQIELMRLLPSVRLFIVYASTETGEISCYEFSADGATENRIGRPVPGTIVRFTDECGVEVTASEDDPAYITVQSDTLMRGYWKDEESTAKVKRGDRVTMSDYGYTDADGYLCIAGRAGDVIISGGHKINPTEVENIALESGLAAECVCTGRRDEMFGKIVTLLVVPKDGGNLDKVAMKNYLSERLEGYKTPKIIERIDKVRRNANGKIDRRYYAE